MLTRVLRVLFGLALMGAGLAGCVSDPNLLTAEEWCAQRCTGAASDPEDCARLMCGMEADASGAMLDSGERDASAEGPDASIACQEDAAQDVPCGPQSEGSQPQICQGGEWQNSGPCNVAPVLTPWLALGPGGHSCFVFNHGGVKCWGDNTYGQLGLGDTDHRGDAPREMGARLPMVDLGPGEEAEQVVVGAEHTCALLKSRQVKCWGRNQYGQLGLGDTEDRGDEEDEMGRWLRTVELSEPVTLLGAGYVHTCAVLQSGRIKCWGLNYSGQLGLGDQETRGDERSDMGESLPTVGLDALSPAIQVVAGAEHTCALLADHEVYCWGGNRHGQLGEGNTEGRGDEPEEVGRYHQPVNIDTMRGSIQLNAGARYTCALLEDGQTRCWGASGGSFFNGWPYDRPREGMHIDQHDVGCGSLGYESTLPVGDQPEEMGRFLDDVDVAMAQLIGITAAYKTTCAYDINGQVKCWGARTCPDLHQLGGNNPPIPGRTPDSMGENLLFLQLPDVVLELSTGESHTCALLPGERVVCWGESARGRLGQGDDIGRSPSPGLKPISL